MSQGYHTNATTNLHSREIIQQSSLSNIELAERFEINEKTISKRKNRDYLGNYLLGFTTLYHDFLKGQLETYRVIL